MKKLILALAVTSLALTSYGQGLVIFDNGGNPAGPNSDGRAYTDFVGGTPAFGSAWYAQLYAADGAGQAEGNLHAVGVPVNFRATSATASSAGYVQFSGTSQGANGAVAVPSSVQVTTSQTSGQVTLQIRAWASTFTTFANATPDKQGKSVTFNLTPDYLPAATTTSLVGLGIPGFVIGVPEPSTIALGVMGLSALLLRRRK